MLIGNPDARKESEQALLATGMTLSDMVHLNQTPEDQVTVERVASAAARSKANKIVYINPVYSGQAPLHALELHKKKIIEGLKIFALNIPDGNGLKSKGMQYVTRIVCITQATV